MHAWRVIRNTATRGSENLIHLAKDMQTSLLCLLKCDFHDLLGDTLDLDIHLQRGNTISSTGNFKVHITQVIFIAKDVG